MPVLLGLFPCPSWGRDHDFCDPDAGAFNADAVDLYTCPATGEGAMLQFVAAAGIELTDHPRGAVSVRRLDMPPGRGGSYPRA
jgi:hypothetical protein